MIETLASSVRRSLSFRARARWLALIVIGIPMAGIVLAIVVPAVMRWLGR